MCGIDCSVRLLDNTFSQAGAVAMPQCRPSMSVSCSANACVQALTSRIARRYPLMMDVGWILLRTRSLARFSNSAAQMTTEVVPSPTS